MAGSEPGFPEDRTSRGRRKTLSKEEIKDLELACGAEGGTQAGSAGAPGSLASGLWHVAKLILTKARVLRAHGRQGLLPRVSDRDRARRKLRSLLDRQG